MLLLVELGQGSIPMSHGTPTALQISNEHWDKYPGQSLDYLLKQMASLSATAPHTTFAIVRVNVRHCRALHRP